MSPKLLAIVTAAAFAATGITLAQDRKPERPGGTSTVTRSVTRTRGTQRRLPEFPKLLGFFTRAMGHNEMKVTVDDEIVTVEGLALVAETDPTVQYIWSIRVYDAPKGGKLLKERHYTDAPISGLGEIAATCRHDLILGPGQYRIELYLYCVPAGFDFSRFERGADLKMVTDGRLSAFQRITIEDFLR
jgi:hypothetical protein